MITFYSKQYNGGYGDRLVGMSAACTIARHLSMKFQVAWEVEPTGSYIDFNVINQTRSPFLETADVRDLWKNQQVVVQANTPIDLCLWSNCFLPELKEKSYELEALQSYRDVYAYLSRSIVNPERFVFGIQIRCGDTYCMPHALAEEYLSESSFSNFSKSLHEYVLSQGIQGRVFVTSDTRKIYPHFDALSNDTIQYVFIQRDADIHYDFHNSDHKRSEIISEHQQLQHCEWILTSLRSNFGTTAAYCSPVCKRITFYPHFKTFDTQRDFVSKEFPNKARA